MFLVFLSAYAVGFSGAVMPGPLLTYTVRKSLAVGPKAGYIIIAGHALLELALVTVIFLGFDAVLRSETAQTVIGFAGGVLLSLMGADMIIGSVRNKVSVKTGDGESGTGNMMLASVILTASNPYFIIWWAIIGLGFIMQAYGSFGFAGVAVYYAGHITADLTWYALVSTIVGKTRRFIGEKTYRIIILCLGCLLVFFGIRFFTGALSGVLG